MDILLLDETAVDTADLTIPHPRMLERAFVMAPLAEIAPDLRLPDGRTPGDVLEGLRDQDVRRLAEVA
jgi:2-amino-4-hydroxy-6-hydroxymethyldihydropteridine diphosphokinase